MIIPFLACGLTAYLVGAIPFGYIVGRLNGMDIRTLGSGNIGATNVARSIGKGWGALVFACDALKGFLPAWLFPLLAARFSPGAALSALGLVCAAAAIAGHIWPVYLKFKGGKGIATSLGALVGVAPLCAITGIAVWALVFGITRYVSVASMAAAAAAAASAWFFYAGGGILLPGTLSVLGALALWRHKSNIQRLLAGTEQRFEFKK